MPKNYTADCKNPSYLLKIRGGVEVDSYGKKAGKGALIAEDISHTLGTSQDQYLFQAITFEPGIASREGGHIYEGVSGTLRAKAGDNQMAVCYEVEMEVAKRKYEVDIERLKELLRSHKTMSNKEIAERLDQPITLVEHYFRTDRYFAIPQPEIWMRLKALLGIETDEFDKPIMEFEFVGGAYDMSNRIWAGDIAPTLTSQCDDYLLLENHPADSRVTIDDSGTCQTLTSRMGTGGGNVPLVMFSKHRRAKFRGDFETWGESGVTNTLNTFDSGDVRATDVVVCETYHCNTEIEKAPPLKARDWKDPLIVVYPETTGSLMASGYNKLGTQEAANDMYIVEKITSTDVENGE